MTPALKRILFLLFFTSGFCGLLYQVIWIRIAFASFGILTSVLSVVVSVFMLGLAIGSWGGGKCIVKLSAKTGISAIIFYALIEFFIGSGAFAVPELFLTGETYLLPFGETNSFSYLLSSALIIAGSILPWTIFMGATFPFMMAFIKEVNNSDATSFSFLYLANVIGAMTGTLVTAIILVELLGFRNTLFVGASLNFTVSIVCILLNRRYQFKTNSYPVETVEAQVQKNSIQLPKKTGFVLFVLFTTGFASMSMEVVWIRAFTPVLKTTVYAFASILFVYLLGTWIGSYIYRRNYSRGGVFSIMKLLGFLSVSSFLPILLNDFRLNLHPVWVLTTIFPVCAFLGYLTPMLIDQYSTGEPEKAGKAYAVNIFGSILGPLLASYLLLPYFGVKTSLIFLAIPFLIFYLMNFKPSAESVRWRVSMGVFSLLLLLISIFMSRDFEEIFSENGIIRRDHTATVISYGQGRNKRLLINGIGITHMTIDTKLMAHLPLALHRGEPQSSLVICFGMGTTYRSLLSWDIKAKAVELAPSVKDAFGYYFDDAEEVLRSPNGTIVIDDGRRFLKRSSETFDVITLDPPPPTEAAGSSLLYSTEFYELAKTRLNKGGILQQWIPNTESKIMLATIKSIAESFPYLKTYMSHDKNGIHLIASMSPIKNLSVDEIISKMPGPAKVDLLEWSKDKNLKKIFNVIFSTKIYFDSSLRDYKVVPITDDRPFNEYFFLRRLPEKLFR